MEVKISCDGAHKIRQRLCLKLPHTVTVPPHGVVVVEVDWSFDIPVNTVGVLSMAHYLRDRLYFYEEIPSGRCKIGRVRIVNLTEQSVNLPKGYNSVELMIALENWVLKPLNASTPEPQPICSTVGFI